MKRREQLLWTFACRAAGLVQRAEHLAKLAAPDATPAELLGSGVLLVQEHAQLSEVIESLIAEGLLPSPSRGGVDVPPVGPVGHPVAVQLVQLVQQLAVALNAVAPDEPLALQAGEFLLANGLVPGASTRD